MNWYITVLSKYAVGRGRARRREYWMFVLFNCIFACAASIIDTALSGFADTYIPIVSGLYSLAVLVPGIAVCIRRLHDIGKSGAWYLIGFIPFVGGIILLVLLCLDGEPHPNKYGADPKGRYGNTGWFDGYSFS